MKSRLVALAAAALLTLAGCAGSGSDPATTGSAAASADPQVLAHAADGRLTVGIKYDQPGLGQKDPDGSFSGFDVDVATYVAGALGVPPEGITFVEAKSAEREGLIARGEVDYIVATYSITDARKQKVNFAGPYFIAKQDLLVRSDNDQINGPQDVSGWILCSVSGSTSAQKVKANYAADAALQEYSTYNECVEALRAGAVEAVTTDDIILAGFANRYPDEVRLVGNGFSEEKYGIGLKKDDTAGTAAINAAIESMIADGSWQAALEKAVGQSGFALPAPPTLGGSAG